MSKKPFNVLAKTAMATALLIPTIPFVAEVTHAAEQQKVVDGLYLHSATGESKYLSLDEFMNLSDDAFTELLIKYGEANIFGVLEGEYVNLGAYLNKDAEFEPLKDGDIPAGKYEGSGETVVVGDETPEEKVNETFFYNLAA